MQATSAGQATIPPIGRCTAWTSTLLSAAALDGLGEDKRQAAFIECVHQIRVSMGGAVLQMETRFVSVLKVSKALAVNMTLTSVGMPMEVVRVCAATPLAASTAGALKDTHWLKMARAAKIWMSVRN